MKFRNSDLIDSVNENDVRVLFDIVRNCSYIKGNKDYNKKAKDTSVFFNEEPVVNAFATVNDGMFPSDSEYAILIYKGICDTLKLGSIGMALLDCEKDLDSFVSIIKWCGNKIVLRDGNFSESNILEGLNELNLTPSKNILKDAKSYLAGAIISLLGHELSHITLGHVLRGSASGETSRNDERQADLGSASISDSTPFAKYSILGCILL